MGEERRDEARRGEAGREAVRSGEKRGEDILVGAGGRGLEKREKGVVARCLAILIRAAAAW